MSFAGKGGEKKGSTEGRERGRKGGKEGRREGKRNEGKGYMSKPSNGRREREKEERM